MLFDAHTHLNYEEFSDEERKERAEEIERSEVGIIIDSGDNVSSSRQALCDADSYSWCYAAVGIHPQYAATCGREELDQIRTLAAHPKAVAIGEIGLDFHYGKDTKEEQAALFRAQIRMANDLRMPIMIHTRDANQLTMDILREEGAFSDERKSWFPERPGQNGSPEPDARVQLHCFSGSAELAREYVRLGATISIGGPVTFRNGRKTAEVVQRISACYLLSETDAPYLTPEPLRGRPNRSPYIEHVVRRIALLQDRTYEETASILYRNGCRFFNISRGTL